MKIKIIFWVVLLFVAGLLYVTYQPVEEKILPEGISDAVDEVSELPSEPAPASEVHLEAAPADEASLTVPDVSPSGSIESDAQNRPPEVFRSFSTHDSLEDDDEVLQQQEVEPSQAPAKETGAVRESRNLLKEVPGSYPIQNAAEFFVPAEERYPGNLGGPPPFKLPETTKESAETSLQPPSIGTLAPPSSPSE